MLADLGPEADRGCAKDSTELFCSVGSRPHVSQSHSKEEIVGKANMFLFSSLSSSQKGDYDWVAPQDTVI